MVQRKTNKKTFWPFGTSDQSRAMVVCLDALVWRLHQLHVPKAEFIKFITCYFPWSLKPSRTQKIQEFDHFHDTVFKPNSEFNLPTVLYQAPINLALEAFALCVLLAVVAVLRCIAHDFAFARAVADQLEPMKRSEEVCKRLSNQHKHIDCCMTHFPASQARQLRKNWRKLASRSAESLGEAFLNKLMISVKKKQKIELTKEQGWYSVWTEKTKDDKVQHVKIRAAPFMNAVVPNWPPAQVRHLLKSISNHLSLQSSSQSPIN